MLKVAFLALPLIAGCATTPAQMYFGRPPIYAAAYNPGSYYSAQNCLDCKTSAQIAADNYAHRADYGPTGVKCSNTHENPNYCIRPANEGDARPVYPGMLPEGGRAVPTGNGSWWVHW